MIIITNKKEEGSDTPVLTSISAKDVLNKEFISPNNTYKVFVNCSSIDTMQDALAIITMDKNFRMIFFSHVIELNINNTRYPLNSSIISILSSGESSLNRKLDTMLYKCTTDFNAEKFLTNIMTVLFKNDENFMGTKLAVGQYAFIICTDRTKFPVAKDVILTSPEIITRKDINEFSNLQRPSKLLPNELTSIKDYLFSKLSNSKKEEFNKTGTVRLAYGLPGFGRLRITIGMQRGTYDVTIRKINTTFLPIEMFHLSPIVTRELLSTKAGLYLVVGKPGSGKTALIATVLDTILQECCINAETMEDPIEYTFNHHNSIVAQMEIGADIESVPIAMKKTMTNDPDLVYMTEIRDANDLRAAIYMANMGIKVFATYHSNSVSDAFNGIKTMLGTDVSSYVIFCAVIEFILYQELLPNAKGKGVTPVHEILLRDKDMDISANPENAGDIGKIIRSYNGCKFFDYDLANLTRAGYISPDTFKYYTNHDIKDPLSHIEYPKYSPNDPNYFTIERG